MAQGGQGGQGPRACRFSAQRVRATSQGKPGQVVWAIRRRNLGDTEPRYHLSNAPEDTTLETLVYAGGSRWHIETEFQTEKDDAAPGAVRTTGVAVPAQGNSATQPAGKLLPHARHRATPRATNPGPSHRR